MFHILLHLVAATQCITMHLPPHACQQHYRFLGSPAATSIRCWIQMKLPSPLLSQLPLLLIWKPCQTLSLQMRSQYKPLKWTLPSIDSAFSQCFYQLSWGSNCDTTSPSIHPSMRSFLMPEFTEWSMNSFTHPSVHLSLHSLVHPFIHPFAWLPQQITAWLHN